ncbi:HNH endonuclease [Bacillus phage vB_BcoS-136]|uniref:NUMOD4 motif protein n=1 Tax=Bacillus phage vB_BcoS-136 TaxID=2419619 RepID=A0A3G3BVR9_9CAUD|nr:HNH endonuclease [Bacillus phage vB_BcoS-136]AYP68230.1 NUMOD4 motif protein [Bacillus phage vB_BcoS-136]
MEIWKPLKSLVENGDYYEVSNLGKVRSIDKIDSSGKRKLGKVLKIKVHKNGYCEVVLKLNGRQKTYKVHRLVALAFIQNPENKLQVNHLDGNKENNNIDNLEWSTNGENQLHSRDIGLCKERGETHYRAKLTDLDVLKIREMYATKKYTYKSISEKFNISLSVVESVVKRRTWKHI